MMKDDDLSVALNFFSKNNKGQGSSSVREEPLQRLKPNEGGSVNRITRKKVIPFLCCFMVA